MMIMSTLIGLTCVFTGMDVTFPEKTWATRPPQELGLDTALLNEAARRLGGRGCIIKDGYVVSAWGKQEELGDWYSSAKPVLSTLLFFAVEEGRVKSVDQRVADFGWEFHPKDQKMTFRHLGAMTSGYARPEEPGEAWAYNDFAIQLYQRTLFDKVFKADAKAVAEAPERLGALGFEDGLQFTSRRRLSASVRDFARIAWFWLNRGRWNETQLLPQRYFDEYMKPDAAGDLPRTRKVEGEDDYLGIGSYGGTSDQTGYGPGLYGFNWWFNGHSRLNPENLNWPDAPPDTVMSLGHAGNCAALFPSLHMMVVCANGKWGEEAPGDPAFRMNQVLKLVAEAAGYHAPVIRVSGELRPWHPVTLSFTGPGGGEQAAPNPFTDYRLNVTFSHGQTQYRVPGYYAADGNAANTSAKNGTCWRARFTPDKPGKWNYAVSFRMGPDIAISEDAEAGTPVSLDGLQGSFTVEKTGKAETGFFATGMLRHENEGYLRFAGTGAHFLKGGAGSPENFLAFADFDQTTPTHHYAPHAADWCPGDPTWGAGKGKNIIGALNYLSGKGMNSVYFLTMNVNGDGKDVWPWTSDTDHLRFDCSKLDQWDLVFSHMDRLGIQLHVITQEQENDQLLDGGALGPERKLYYRELIARFGHHLGVTWNLGEENTNTNQERKAFAEYIRGLDPYKHPIAVHTYPGDYKKVYTPLLGSPHFDGPSLQIADKREVHKETLRWVLRAREAGRPWVVCQDEIGPPEIGVRPDAEDPAHDAVRRYALWGNLMAGGAGCEWFFQSDIQCEDWRLRGALWDQTRIALEFFQQYLPFAGMRPLLEGMTGDEAWCLAQPGRVYAVYTPHADEIRLDLPRGSYTVRWYNPRAGGEPVAGDAVHGGKAVSLGDPPHDPDSDWVILVEKKR